MQGLRVLVVDHEPAIRKFLSLVLTDAGYTVIGAVSGLDEVDDSTKRGRPDVLLVDAGPKVSTTLDTLRKAFHHVPVCLMFASGPFTGSELKAEGVTLLTKPFTHEKLLQALRDAQSAMPDISVTVHAPVSLDDCPRSTPAAPWLPGEP